MAEPGQVVQAFDQDRWAASLDATAQPLEEAVALIGLLREILARQLRGLPEATWRASVQHSERGTMTLEQWLAGDEGHLHTHLAQMERTVAAWRTA